MGFGFNSLPINIRALHLFSKRCKGAFRPGIAQHVNKNPSIFGLNQLGFFCGVPFLISSGMLTYRMIKEKSSP
jgi:hypothetical protein